MKLKVLDPRTGDRVTMSVRHKVERDRARRQVLRELARLTDQHR